MATGVLPCGPAAWLVETDDVLGLAAAVRAEHAAAGFAFVDVVPAARTLLVTMGSGTDGKAAEHWLGTLTPRPLEMTATDVVVEIAVCYDGADLADVATATGLSVADVVELHHGSTYTSAFCGFAPGFAYLTGLDPRLHLPRRATPRTRVPAGAVAIAAEYAAVYPSVSPGGWHLLGHTEAELWSLDRDPPALLAPGTRVRFVEVGPP